MFSFLERFLERWERSFIFRCADLDIWRCLEFEQPSWNVEWKSRDEDGNKVWKI